MYGFSFAYILIICYRNFTDIATERCDCQPSRNTRHICRLKVHMQADIMKKMIGFSVASWLQPSAAIYHKE